MANFKTSNAVLLAGLCLASASAEGAIGLSRGSPDIAELSGSRGALITRVEEIARGKAAIGLSVLYRDGVACGVALEGRKLAKNANFETRTVSRCSTGRGSSDSETAEVSWREHLGGFRVCLSQEERETVAGLDIEARAVDETGVLDSSNESGFSGSDCERWGSWSTCTDNELVTGVVVHFALKVRGTEAPDSLVGLQAVCREVISK